MIDQRAARPVVEGAKRLRLHGIWRAVGIALIATVLTLSLMPIEADLGENRDKLWHFLAYGTLMFWFGMLIPARRRQLVIALAFCAMGAGVEFLQDMTPYRSYELADMMANSVGVLIGWSVVLTPLKHSLAWIEDLIFRNREA